MPRSLTLLLAVVLLTSTAIAQATAQATPQTPPTTQAATPPDSGITLHTRTQLVFVDVVVTDNHQNPIHNLKATDFTLLENNAPQQVKHFEEHVATAATDAAKLPHTPSLPPGIFTNYSAAPGNGAINILLLDTLNTPTKDQIFVHSQLQEYLKNARPGTPIAIFSLTNRLTLLQGFTSDPELLKLAINQKPVQGSPLLDDPNGGGKGSENLAQQIRRQSLEALQGRPDNTLLAILVYTQQFEDVQKSFRQDARAKFTLAAMNELAAYLAGIPGRKNLMWFSGSFPLNLYPDPNIANGNDPFLATGLDEDELRRTISMLARSQVAVYPIDARGGNVSPTADISHANSTYTTDSLTFAKDERQFSSDTSKEQELMRQMADGTGGRAFVNTNGLSHAVAKIVDNGSNYYTLTYTPTNTKWDGEFRKIQVKLQQQGVNLSYRRGYFADDPDAPVKHGEVTAATALPLDPMHSAMTVGAPGPTEIIFKVGVLPIGPPTENTIADGNTPDPKTKGPYRRYSVNYAASPKDITFTHTPTGAHRARVQFVVFVYDQEGNILNSIGNIIEASYSPTDYNNILRRGLQFHQEISVPVKGDSYLRIGIHDLSGDHVGAVELPIAAVKNLPPPPASTAPATSAAVAPN